MKLYVYPNRFTEEQIQTAVDCIARFTDKGIPCGMPEDLYAILRADRPGLLNLPVSACDAVVSIGGDGSVLRAAQVAVKAQKPLFGINNGHVGYLCRFRLSDVAELTEELLFNIRYAPRTLLSFEKDGKTHFALNDVVIGKCDFSTALRIAAELDGQSVGAWHGDGLIVATPVGSTAYNRSAGGPRLVDASRCFVLTPICSLIHPATPIVYPDTATLTVRADGGQMRPSVYADGVSYGEIERELILKRYPFDLNLATKE